MINGVEYIFFDCMETLIDLYKLPSLEDYAMWAYDGSGAEGYWESFDDFVGCYAESKRELASSLPEHAEYEMRGRFLHMIRSVDEGMPAQQAEAAADLLYRNYWKNYKAQCYVSDEVRETLERLKRTVPMAVVSNFMVMDGIEELLEMLDIRKYFSFVVTSVKVGRRKPHSEIYKEAVRLSGVSPGQIVFVGDDYVNDYIAPCNIGMKAIYYDKNNRHTDAKLRIVRFPELPGLLGLNT